MAPVEKEEEKEEEDNGLVVTGAVAPDCVLTWPCPVTNAEDESALPLLEPLVPPPLTVAVIPDHRARTGDVAMDSSRPAAAVGEGMPSALSGEEEGDERDAGPLPPPDRLASVIPSRVLTSSTGAR